MILSRDFVKLVVKCVGPEQRWAGTLEGGRAERNECVGMRAWDAYARQALIPDEVCCRRLPVFSPAPHPLPRPLSSRAPSLLARPCFCDACRPDADAPHR